MRHTHDVSTVQIMYSRKTV